MGQVESVEAASSVAGTPLIKIDPRAIQIFHGLRPELLLQLDDLRTLLHDVAGLDLGPDPLMDPDCTVHDAVSSLLSQYVDKVGTLAATVRDAGSLVPVSFSPSPSFSGGSPIPQLYSPTSTSSAQAPSSIFSSSTSTSATNSAANSASNSAANSAAGPDPSPPSTPPLERARPRALKRPMKRFSASKWVGAVVKAMGQTSNRAELERLESGLESLARAEHDWLAAKLGAVAGRALRLPPSRVEEVTAVGLAVWVEFWNTWAGRTLTKSATSSGSGALPPRPGSSAGARKLQNTPSAKWRKERDLPLPPFIEAPDHASWRGKKPPPLTMLEPPTPSSIRPAGAPPRENGHILAIHPYEERQDLKERASIAHSDVYDHLATRPHVSEGAALYSVDLGVGLDRAQGRDDASEGSPRGYDDMVPISLEGDEERDGREKSKPEPMSEKDEGSQGQSSLFGLSLQGFYETGEGEGASGGVGPKEDKEEERPTSAGQEHSPHQREASKEFSAARFVDMEAVMRADIGSRLQKTLLEECLAESAEGSRDLEQAPPPHSEIVRLLGLAASATALRQVSAAACVLRLLDGLGREWRGGDETPPGGGGGGMASPHVPKDWDRILETKECRGFVLQCLVDLLEACALRCKSRHASGIQDPDLTPTGRVRRLKSLGEDDFAATPLVADNQMGERKRFEAGWGELGDGELPHSLSVPRDYVGSARGDSDSEGDVGPPVPCPASLVELAESSLVWKTFHRKDLKEAQKFQELDKLFDKPVGPGILALALADEAQKLRHLSTQDLWALSDQVEDLGCFEAAFRLRLRAIAGEYEDMDSVVEVVRTAYHTRGIESVPLRLKRLVNTARFALTHAPSASARHDYAMTFGACMLEPLLEDPTYPWAFEIADNYVGLSGLFGPVEKGEEEDVQLRTKLLCARMIMKTVVEPLLVETEDPQEEQGDQGDDLSSYITKALAEGRGTGGVTLMLAGRLRGHMERDDKEQRGRRRKRKERALKAWAEGVDYPGIEVGWLQWQAIGMLLQSHNPHHPALVTMWAKAVRGNFKAINEEGSSADKEAVELFDWGLEGLLLAFAGDGRMLHTSPMPSPALSTTSSYSGRWPSTPPLMHSPHKTGPLTGSGRSDRPTSILERREGGESAMSSPRVNGDASDRLSCGPPSGGEEGHTMVSLRDHCLGDLEPARLDSQRPGVLEISSGQHPELAPVTPSRLPFDCDWLEQILEQVRPRERDKVDLLLAVASRMASAIYWKWPKRKENQKFIARLLLYTHRVVGLNEQQKQRAMKVGERIWGWMLPNAALVRDQCENDEEAQEIMENAIYATWIGASA